MKKGTLGRHSTSHISIAKLHWEKVLLSTIRRERNGDLKRSMKELDGANPTSFHHHLVVDE